MRLLLLLPTTTYRTEAFVSAALKLGIELTVASEQPSALETAQPDKLLTLDLGRPERAVDQAAAFAARHPVDGVFGVDDHTALVAAMIAAHLGLPHSPVEALRAAGDKYLQRMRLREAGVRVPEFQLLRDLGPRASAETSPPGRAISDAHVHTYASSVPRLEPQVRFPVVLKPLRLAASRGVIRADDPQQFRRAWARLCMIVAEAEGPQSGAAPQCLVEAYVPGDEFALEGIVTGGELHVLALFDKPDPLEGPFFPETIYVTPSRAPREVERLLVRCAAEAVRALGLTRGPVHAELRVNGAGAWLIELAARPIGGKCGAVLRFGAGGEVTLEELHLAHALGLRSDVPPLAPGAHGVMMIPIPRAGVLRGVRGLDRARAVPGVTDVIVSLHRGASVRPLPEDARYLGFIFAHGSTPADVEGALRAADGVLDVEIE